MPLVQFIIKRPTLVVIIVLIISLAAGYEAFRLPVITSIEALVRKDDPDRIFYSKFRRTFGADDAIVVALGAKEIFTRKVLEYIKALTEKIEALDGVEDCLSIISTETIRGLNEDFIVEPLFEDGLVPSGEDELKEIKAKAFSNPLIVGNIINASSNATLILVRTASHEDDQEFESRLLAKIHEILDETPPPPGIQGPFVAGWPVVDVYNALFINRDVRRFVPISSILMALIVFSFVQNIYLTLAIIGIMILSLIWTLGLLALIGGAMSPLTSILAPLIMALSLADGIHLVLSFLRLDNIFQAIFETWWPSLLTSLTTASGFLSLLVSDIPAIRHFGISAAGGMIGEFVLTYTFLIAFLTVFMKRKSNIKYREHSYPFQLFLSKLYYLIQRKGQIIILFSVFFSIAACLAIQKLNVDSNLLHYFFEDSDIRIATNFIDHNLGGAETVEISLKGKLEGSLIEKGAMKNVDNLTTWLGNQEGIGTVITLNSFLKLMNKAFHNDDPAYFTIPTSREMAAQYLLLYDGSELFHFSDESYSWVRISARSNLHGTKALNDLLTRLKAKCESVFNSKIAPRFTGKTYILNRMATKIVKSQIESLILASAIIFSTMFLVLRSVPLGILSIIPNVIPIIGNFGFMGIFGIPINTATAIISAVAIGIIVDDTIHFVVQFKRAEKRCNKKYDVIKKVMIQKGPAILSTSIVLFIGFGVLVISNFVPTVQFGILAGFTILLALIADLMILPSLLLNIKEMRK